MSRLLRQSKRVAQRQRQRSLRSAKLPSPCAHNSRTSKTQFHPNKHQLLLSPHGATRGRVRSGGVLSPPCGLTRRAGWRIRGEDRYAPHQGRLNEENRCRVGRKVISTPGSSRLQMSPMSPTLASPCHNKTTSVEIPLHKTTSVEIPLHPYLSLAKLLKGISGVLSCSSGAHGLRSINSRAQHGFGF